MLIVAHGDLAGSLFRCAEMIVGKDCMSNVHYLNMTPEKSMEQFALEAKAILDREPNGSYLIIADLFGASPLNASLSAFRHAAYRAISGANLPMLLELLTLRDSMNLEQLWMKGQEIGREGIRGVFVPVAGNKTEG